MKKKWFTITDKELVDDWGGKGLNLVTGFVFIRRKELYRELHSNNKK